jgi:DNA-binding transcriptional regulator YdaS (Cro superfamily)
MKLSAYIKTFPRYERIGVRRQIAEAAGVTEPAVRHWCNGLRKIPSDRIRAIEKVTAGAVTCYDMLPEEINQ